MNSSFDAADLAVLIEAMLEGDGSGAELNRVHRILADQPGACRYYARYMVMRAQLIQDAGSIGAGQGGNPGAGGDIEDPFSDVHEITPPSVPEDNEAARVSRPLKLLGQAAPDFTTRRIARYPHVPFWPAMAAAVLVVASLAVFISRQGNRISDGKSQRAVATVTATVRATWDDPAAATLPIATPLSLNAGYVELTFAGGARVVVEAPARFTLDSSAAISLASGKLSATVHGGGFVVNTPTAMITDLGTQFGVSVQAGSTRVEVFEGRVQIAPPTSAQGSAGISILAVGQAATISSAGLQADPAGSSPQRFVRSLSTGVAALDVVDLVAGGDGTTHHRGIGIDAATGKAGVLPQVAVERGDYAYHRVAGLPVVDGCFIPDGSRGPMQTDSSGHRFAFPMTTNQTFNLIWAGGGIPAGNKRSGAKRAMSTLLDGVDYSKPAHACLAMHASKGLTLNLDEVRRLHPLGKLSRLICTVGNSWAPLPDEQAKPPLPAKCYVIVDGQQRFTLTIQASGAHVEVPLARSDRFLTLVTADGGTDSGANWILVADPVIDFAAGENAKQ